jgi:phosphatidate cytidylyltransferase
MAKRILSTFLLWAFVLACIYFFGAPGGVWLVTLIAALTQREFYLLVRKLGLDPFDRLAIFLGILISLSPLYLEPYLYERSIGSDELLAGAVILFSLRILGERDAGNRVETLGWTIFGLLYVPFMLHFLARIIVTPGPHANTGLAFCLWLIAVSKFCDVGALLSGLAFGKHAMAPNISPKKTWEGAIGGVLISAGVGAGIAHFAAKFFPATFSPWLAALVAAPIAALAIVSDLVESIIKRRADAKDAGQTIPGIGGFFDLSDSLILTAPLGYVALKLL